jgi:1,4-alpha-glucan branching enzyme
VRFAVWAPNAGRVSVVGDFNHWAADATPLHPRGTSGVWEGFVEGVGVGGRYKYHVRGPNGYRFDKTDPYAFACEVAPDTASVVSDLTYTWRDGEWMTHRKGRNGLTAPCAVYEMHLGSWRRKPEEGNRPLTYRELADVLPEYAAGHGFTHVEFLPVMEHPFYGSWGYQTTGYFAATSRYGSPQDLMALVDALHRRGVGVILDWVPSHFPCDGHGLSYFDGTHLYEHADRRQGYQPDWGSYVFNYGRREVANFLINSALFWLEKYHADGLRVDAVASMLYRDYSRKAGEWVPNEYGGRENLEAVAFLKRLNEQVYARFPDVQTFAEESTAWPSVSRPTYLGGLGFGLKWDMGWMHDTLKYVAEDPVHRKYHHHRLTFRSVYAFSENFILPLSHDEVVHGKGSLLGKMPGDEWQQRATLRLLLAYQWTQPGKKLLFMGGEFGQRAEWNHDASLDWHLLADPKHAGVARWVGDLNHAYRSNPALHARDCDPGGVEWVEANDADQSVYCYLRRGFDSDPPVVAAFNFTPVVRRNYRLGVPTAGVWRELLNSDAPVYGGGGQGNFGGVEAVPFGSHGQPHSVAVTLPPLSAVLFAPAA